MFEMSGHTTLFFNKFTHQRSCESIRKCLCISVTDDGGADITRYEIAKTKRQSSLYYGFYGYDMITPVPLNKVRHMRYDMVGSGSFTAVTVSLWLKTTPVTSQTRPYFFSWATTGTDNALIMGGSDSSWTTQSMYVKSFSDSQVKVPYPVHCAQLDNTSMVVVARHAQKERINLVWNKQPALIVKKVKFLPKDLLPVKYVLPANMFQQKVAVLV